jgi:hypothetical protein
MPSQGAAFAKKLSWFKLNAASVISLKFNIWKELRIFFFNLDF